MNHSKDMSTAENCYDLMFFNTIHWSWGLFSLPTVQEIAYPVKANRDQHPEYNEKDKNSR